MQFKQFALLACATAFGALLACNSANAAIIEHEDTGDGAFRTIRTSESSPTGQLTVSSAQTINGIGVDVDLNSGGNIEFLIFDATTGALLLNSGPEFFADTGAGYKDSALLSFTFQPGITYSVGGIADVGGDWYVDFTPNSVGAFSFLTGNQNVSGFLSPTLNTTANCCDVGYRLFTGTVTDVPEPITLSLFGTGLAGAIAMRRRKKKAA